jgi:effector-binding domain-containing protein
MEQKIIPSTSAFYRSFETSLATMGQYVGQTPSEMYAELAKLGKQPASPQIWIYKGGDGNPETKFELQIAIPVAGNIAGETPEFTVLPEFKCLTMVHNGPWENLKHSYGQIIGYLMQNGMQMGNECREIYHCCDFENPENNITEIQIGLS